MDELKELESERKKLIVKTVLSVASYAFGIVFFTMQMDIGMKVIFGLLFCGLPFALGYNSRKMDKLTKKAQDKGVAVVVVKQKRKGLLRKILTAVLGLACGIVATPYLVVKNIMAIVADSKRIKELRSGGNMSGEALQSATVATASAESGIAAATDGTAAPTDGIAQQNTYLMQQLQQQQQAAQEAENRRKRSVIIRVVVTLVSLAVFVAVPFLTPEIIQWVSERNERKAEEAQAEAIAAMFGSDAYVSRISVGMSSGDVNEIFREKDEQDNTWEARLESSEYAYIGTDGELTFGGRSSGRLSYQYYYPEEYVQRIEEIKSLVGDDWRANISGYYTTDEAERSKIEAFLTGVHTEIVVTYRDSAVACVMLDKAAPASATAERQKKELVNLSVSRAYFIEGIPEAYISYTARFADGSFIRAETAVPCEVPSSGEATVTWSDAFYDGYSVRITETRESDSAYTSDNGVLSIYSGILYVFEGSGTSNAYESFSRYVKKLVVYDGASIAGGTYKFPALEEVELSDGYGSLPAAILKGSKFYLNDANWEGDCLYAGNTLVGLRENVASVKIKDGTKRITENLFNMEELSELFIPESIQDMRGCSYNWNPDLRITYAGSEEQWEQVKRDFSIKDENLTFLK